MEIGHSKSKLTTQIILAIAFVAVLGLGAYGYIAWQERMPEDSPTAQTQAVKNITVQAPKQGESLRIGDTYTIAWTAPSDLPNPAYLDLILADGPTPGIIAHNVKYTDGHFVWKIAETRNDDVLLPIKPGTYSLQIKVYKEAFCDQADCSNGQVTTPTPVAQGHSASFTLAASPTTSASPTPSPSPVSDWKTYTNPTYGYKLTFGDEWKGYTVKTTSENGIDTIQISMPTTDRDWAPQTSASIFAISAQSLGSWTQELKTDLPHPRYIAQNDTHVFAYSHPQDLPEDIGAKNLDVEKVLASFSFGANTSAGLTTASIKKVIANNPLLQKVTDENYLTFAEKIPAFGDLNGDGSADAVAELWYDRARMDTQYELVAFVADKYGAIQKASLPFANQALLDSFKIQNGLLSVTYRLEGGKGTAVKQYKLSSGKLIEQ